MPSEDSERSHSVPIEILLVDDHSHVRKILREVALKPAAVVMDVHLPLVSGIAATTLIKTTNPFIAIIGLTAGDPHEDEKAMKIAGAAAIINKDGILHDLYPAVVDAVKRTKNPV